jgi:hypothetical protein
MKLLDQAVEKGINFVNPHFVLLNRVQHILDLPDRVRTRLITQTEPSRKHTEVQRIGQRRMIL